jgi:aspartate racemase
MRTLGILGGMGPMAGACFYQRVIEKTPAECDGEHLPVLLYGVPQIPDRSAHLCGDGPSPLPALVKGVGALCAAGAVVIAIPCNTAHAYLGDLRERSSVPILDMPALALARAAALGWTSLGVLCTHGSLQSGIFRAEAERLGISLILPSVAMSRVVGRMIYRVKAGVRYMMSDYRPYINALLEQGADGVLLGCTELSISYVPCDGLPLLDGLDVLAEAAVSACTRGDVGVLCDAVFRASF